MHRVRGQQVEGEGETQGPQPSVGGGRMGGSPRGAGVQAGAREEEQGVEELMGIFTEVKSDGAKGTKRKWGWLCEGQTLLPENRSEE